jgi:hypothetical protein
LTRECKKCGAGLEGQRRTAKQCPACRLLQILRWSLERKRVRKCVRCEKAYRSSSEHDLSYCASCAETTTSPAVANLFRGRVGRCEVCAERGDAWWEPPPVSSKELKWAAAMGREVVPREAREKDRLALDHRVPLCAHCAKHPEYQAKAVAWLERTQQERKAKRDNPSPARDTA